MYTPTTFLLGAWGYGAVRHFPGRSRSLGEWMKGGYPGDSLVFSISTTHEIQIGYFWPIFWPLTPVWGRRGVENAGFRVVWNWDNFWGLGGLFWFRWISRWGSEWLKNGQKRPNNGLIWPKIAQNRPFSVISPIRRLVIGSYGFRITFGDPRGYFGSDGVGVWGRKDLELAKKCLKMV